MSRMTIDQASDARDAARQRRESKACDRIAAREDKADQMIGELSSGKCYVWPVGGKYREGTRTELVQFLIRNNYA
jgi:hypothetical protein